MKAGIDPRAWETMSLYELESMWRNMNPPSKEPTDAEWEEAERVWADATAGMSDVRL